jgi:hypothetical protein
MYCAAYAQTTGSLRMRRSRSRDVSRRFPYEPETRQEQQIVKLAKSKVAQDVADVLGEAWLAQVTAWSIGAVVRTSYKVNAAMVHDLRDLSEGDPFIMGLNGDLLKTGAQKVKVNVRVFGDEGIVG